ncbi:MAG: Holliday junction branch migration protein RuvA [Acidobacteriota bacterium]
MIALLRGRLAHKGTDRIIVETGGVGYEVFVPLSTYYELAGTGETVELQIYTHVREDAIQLFGFRTSHEKRVFLLLIQVSGIGPRLACTILSGLPLDDFLDAVARRDVARLSTIPGVGRKTAERIALELKEKIQDLAPAGAAAGPAEAGVERDVLSALVNLGYPRARAEAAVLRLRGSGTARFEDMLKRALREISG